MPILPSQIQTRLSTKSGTAGDQLPETPNNSLGKYVSTTIWSGGVLHDLFDVITGDENANLVTDYRCIFVVNTSSLTWQNVYAWLTAIIPGGANLEIGVDPTPASSVNSTLPQATYIASETVAPAGVSFSAPITKATAVPLGDIPANHCRAIWFKRTATGSAAMALDGATLVIEGDSPP